MTEQEKTAKCAELVQKSKGVVRETFKKFDPVSTGITWTGGKDSTLNLWIIRQVCVEDNIDLPRVMTIDEGDAFPEITDFLMTISKKWCIDLECLCNWDVLKAAMSHLNNTVMVGDLNERNKAELKRIGSEADSFTWEWTGDEAALDRMLWPVVGSAADLLTSEDLDRVGECQGDGCGWLFIDMSRNHSRRWCDMGDCGNRAKARRHYRRKKASLV